MEIGKLALAAGLGVGFLMNISQAAVRVSGFEGELKTQIEFREDVYDRDTIPFDNYLKLDLKDVKGTDIHFYGKLWKDLGYGTDWDVDLYQLYVVVPINKGKNGIFTVGRQFISEGFETYVADALKVTNNLKNGIRYTFYLGKPRFFEPETPDGDNFLAGFKFDYKGYYLGFEHVRDEGKVKKSAFVLGDYKYLTKKLSQYARLELDTAHGEVVNANIGFNYFPVNRLRLNTELEFYDGSYFYDGNLPENRIFYLFSPEGRELRFTQSAYFDLNKKWQLFGSCSLTDLQTYGKDNGYLVKVGTVRDTWFNNGLRAYGALLYQNSWLGILRGVELGFTKYVLKGLTLSGTAQVARYDKITYGRQWSSAYYLKGTYQTTEFSNLEFGVDYRNNEDFNHDLRLIFRYNFLFWGGKGEEKTAEAKK